MSKQQLTSSQGTLTWWNRVYRVCEGQSKWWEGETQEEDGGRKDGSTCGMERPEGGEGEK